MKKILSLLLVCTMIFSFAAINVSADDAAYTLEYVDITAVKSGRNYFMEYDLEGTAGPATATVFDAEWNEDTMREAGIFAIALSANVPLSTGYFAISYDTSVIMPAIITCVSNSGAFEAQTIDDFDTTAGTTNDVVVASEAKFSELERVITQDGFGFVIMGTDGPLAANENLYYFHFAFKDGKTVDDLNSDSIKFAATDAVYEGFATETQKSVTSKGAASIVSDGNDLPVQDASNANRTYPNVGQPAGGETKTTVLAIDAENSKATANVYYEKAVSGTAIIAVYDANGTMLNLATKEITTATTDVEDLEVSYAGKGTAKTVKVFVWSGYGSTNVAQVGAETYTAE